MNGTSHLGQTLGILAPFGQLISYGAVTGSVEGLDPAALVPLLYDPAPSQILTGFNLGIWFEYRAARAVASLQKLVGWIASGQVRTPAVFSMPLADAAEAHRLLETGSTTGKIVLKPEPRTPGRCRGESARSAPPIFCAEFRVWVDVTHATLHTYSHAQSEIHRIGRLTCCRWRDTR
jgi:hypothetical protein